MSAAWGHVTGVVILLMMLIFISIWIWAWAKRHKPVFDQMAQLPMEDEDEPRGGKSPGSKGDQP